MHPAVARVLRYTRAALLKHSHLVAEAMRYADALQRELCASPLQAHVMADRKAPLFVEAFEVCHV